MRYTIYHLTRFRFTAPVVENVMEVRVQPCSDARQSCVDFSIVTRPAARVDTYVDHAGTQVHHFDIPGSHRELSAIAVSLVDVADGEPDPALLPQSTWAEVDALADMLDFWDYLHPTPLTRTSELLCALARELALDRSAPPLTTLLQLNTRLHRTLAYDVEATEVDSPIEDALQHRRGVCQDYAHIMLALLRNHLHIPCRYVSGYLYHSTDDRSADGASHAWLEAWLPGYGWLGLDPTNNLPAGARHIRVGAGRDYHDVPPTRGVYRGAAVGDLLVRVRVRRSAPDVDVDEELSAEVAQQTSTAATTNAGPLDPAADPAVAQQQQQQQQQ